MKIQILNAEAKERWNAFVAGWPDFGLMQTYEWGEFKENSGWKAIRIAVERDNQFIAGAQLLLKLSPLDLTSIAYIPRGPLADWRDEAVVQALMAALHKIARQYRAIYLKIEPPIYQTSEALQLFQQYRFCRSRYDNQPRSSMIVDLTPDIGAILSKMHKSTQYNIRYSERKGVVVREGDQADVSIFYRLLQQTAERAGFPARSLDYYQTEWATLARAGMAKLFLATHNGEILAMRMPAACGRRAATLHSGSSDQGRHLKPNELLMWECLKWAKAQGCTSYDVWGIPDEVGEMLSRGEPIPDDRKGGLWGVYYFKRGFGGVPISYVGSYDYVYSQPLYRLFNAMTSRLGSLDKFAQLSDRLHLKPELPAGM